MHGELKKTPNANWWASKYFYTDGKHKPLYCIYGELEGHGFNLDDIDMLCQILTLGDSITTSELNGSRTRPKTRRHVRTRHALPPLSDIHLSEVKALADEAEQGRKSLFVTLSYVDKKLHELAQHKTLDELAPLPVIPALLEFNLLDRCRFSKVGQKSDLWGSFFLLLVTEYFKNESDHVGAMAHGTAIQHYREAGELLRACRILHGRLEEESPFKHRRIKTGSKKPGSSKKRRKWTVAKRIENLKKSHPDWSDAVVPILLQLQLIRNGESHRYRANTRRFVERWISERRLTKKFLRELERRGLQLPPIDQP